VVILGDSGLGPEEQLSAALGLVSKVGGIGASGKAGDPVAPADRGALPQFQPIKVHGHGEGINAGVGRHGKVAGIDPRQADASGVMQAVAIEPLKAPALEGPGQGHNQSSWEQAEWHGACLESGVCQ